MKIILTFLVGVVLMSSNFGFRQMSSNQRTAIQSPSPESDVRIFDTRAKASGFKDFDSEELSKTDVEIRIWATGGFSPLRGIIISKRDGTWTSNFLPPLIEESDSSDVTDLSDRFSDWDRLEKMLTDDSLNSLQNTDETDKQVLFHDGQTVSVEFRRGDGLRMVLSSMEPCAQKNKIGKLLCGVVKEVQQNLDITLLVLPSAPT